MNAPPGRVIPWRVLFSVDGFDTEALRCPDCGELYLHHSRVEIFERGEDDDHVIRTIVETGRTLVDRVPHAGSGNPSTRRDGLRILFWCENCGADAPPKILNIEQHKGMTYRPLAG